MRPRDVRAILFWTVSTAVLILLSQALLHRWVLTGVAAAAYNAWLLSRPRMIRVFRRLSGQRTGERYGGYFQD